ncbi:L-2,4-diaminobutyric acid acetyltransferase [Nocardia sputorum]|uniref:L-2,4-diaminobutyric acid acetyltransferase n=2 Tax=Nocardiaceae TaxID=85025 RepID=A0ABM8CXK3_9NOCA|nr:L-2,4-diaminobutyric acid acetyltransferase [Nocardia sputorum]BDT99729.1 L-2,4-diaminobutyric acid acetyltransferase [Nocardia sputorum]
MSLPTLSPAEIERSRVGNAAAALGATPSRKETGPAVVLRTPRLGDGAPMWRIAKDSAVLDVNSSYAYLLWCRDFAGTSVVAELDGRVVGYVIGFVRPQAPDTVFVWQIAVDRSQRGRGIGAELLHTLLNSVAAQGVSVLETTISPDNAGSIALFTSVAQARGADLTKRPLFDAGVFPDSHAPEDLYRIAPTARTTEEDHR